MQRKEAGGIYLEGIPMALRRSRCEDGVVR